MDRDVFAAVSSDGAAVITHLEYAAVFLTGTRHFGFPETMAAEDEMLRVFIRQFYEGRAFVPGELFVSHALEDAGWIEEGLAARKARRCGFIGRSAEKKPGCLIWRCKTPERNSRFF